MSATINLPGIYHAVFNSGEDKGCFSDLVKRRKEGAMEKVCWCLYRLIPEDKLTGDSFFVKAKESRYQVRF
jgi:hypothetical protein